MHYIAGLTGALPSSTQTIEGIAVFTTLRYFQFVMSRVRAIAPVAEAEAGSIRTTPSSFIGKIISPIHALSIFIPPVTYILCVPFNRFVQPAWMQRMSLPNTYFKHESQVGLRVAACAATFLLIRFSGRIFTHLGNQWHPIGRREKPRVVQTGPYAVVRHPIYTSVLVQELLFTLMSWSYAPLVALGITAGAFAIKMPIEEDLIIQDPATAAEYRAYMQRVPARVIPFLW
jgi:protein-S-isoprenylcysteine O-methyltransferase Ste14